MSYKIKQLKWFTQRGVLKAITKFGFYEIESIGTYQFAWSYTPYGTAFGDPVSYQTISEDLCKIKCQMHFESIVKEFLVFDRTFVQVDLTSPGLENVCSVLINTKLLQETETLDKILLDGLKKNEREIYYQADASLDEELAPVFSDKAVVKEVVHLEDELCNLHQDRVELIGLFPGG